MKLNAQLHGSCMHPVQSSVQRLRHVCLGPDCPPSGVLLFSSVLNGTMCTGTTKGMLWHAMLLLVVTATVALKASCEIKPSMLCCMASYMDGRWYDSTHTYDTVHRRLPPHDYSIPRPSHSMILSTERCYSTSRVVLLLWYAALSVLLVIYHM